MDKNVWKDDTTLMRRQIENERRAALDGGLPSVGTLRRIYNMCVHV